jgi:hypothetical protein
MRPLGAHVSARSLLAAVLVLVPAVLQAAPCPSDPVGRLFPANNHWNADISQLPVLNNSTALVASIGNSTGLHPDFGGDGEYGIPYIVVDQSQPLVPIHFTAYGDESDPGPYPIPLNAPIEGGSGSTGDRHVLAFHTGSRILYELYRAFPQTSQWNADSGAVFDTTIHAQRPLGWTSADAAGLPILAGLIRYEEVQCGEIQHAIRFTVQRSRRAYIYPASHHAGSTTDPNVPAMGQRFRLKAGFTIDTFPPQARVILQALKTYGMIVADNGSNWYITGSQDPRWNDSQLNTLKQVLGNNFEAVDTSQLPVPSASPCDLNADSLTNVSDVQISANQAIGAASCTADINRDGSCSVIDVQRVVNAALGGACVSP